AGSASRRSLSCSTSSPSASTRGDGSPCASTASRSIRSSSRTWSEPKASSAMKRSMVPRQSARRPSAKPRNTSAGMPCGQSSATTNFGVAQTIASAGTRAGCVAAACSATSPPSDQPHHGASGTTSSSARTQASSSSGTPQSRLWPCPGRSTTCKVRCARRRSTSGARMPPCIAQPCSSTSGGPLPTTSTCRLIERGPLARGRPARSRREPDPPRSARPAGHRCCCSNLHLARRRPPARVSAPFRPDSVGRRPRPVEARRRPSPTLAPNHVSIWPYDRPRQPRSLASEPGSPAVTDNASLLQRRDAAIPRGVGTAMTAFADRAENAELWDVEGRRYVDFAGGIAVLNVGHRHPKVMAAVRDQLERFTHTAFQVNAYEPYVALAERLNALAPIEGPAKTILFSTGAEAVENAIKIARAATGRHAVVAFGGGFHGRSFMAMALTGKTAPYKKGFGPLPGGVYHLPFPHAEADVARSLQALQELFKSDVAAEDVAAIIIEPVQGEGGFHPAPPALLRALREVADSHGIVLVADEVQTGIGRTGRLFAV